MNLNSSQVYKLKPVIFFSLIVPSVLWFYQYFVGNLGINPIDKLMDRFGEFALQIIVLTLFISSLSKFRYFRSLQMLRRMIGLFAFYYVCLHFFTYIFLDHFFNFKFIIKDIVKRPFITLGFISFVCLIPLAVTSNNFMVKKLSYKVWKNLHKIIYIIAPLATLHYFLLTKADKREPMIYFLIIFSLLIFRLLSKIIKR